jgi:predicted dithiol-disulfide oxidoreductase (DUF899 family)
VYSATDFVRTAISAGHYGETTWKTQRFERRELTAVQSVATLNHIVMDSAESHRMPDHPVVSREEWLTARKQLLLKEKELTRQRDELHRQRRELPWVKVEKTYVFDGANGKVTLSDLFEGRSQLIVQHFMFAPDWAEGCTGCSFKSDHIDGARVHLEHHDVAFASVSRAPIEKIDAYRKRMGWTFTWVSSFNSDFNYDFNVSFRPGEPAIYNYRELPAGGGGEASGDSVFFKDENGDIYHTYSTFARGDEILVGTYNYLDMTPKGRNETGPGFNLMDWVKRHDQYESAPVRLAKSTAGDSVSRR